MATTSTEKYGKRRKKKHAFGMHPNDHGNSNQVRPSAKHAAKSSLPSTKSVARNGISASNTASPSHVDAPKKSLWPELETRDDPNDLPELDRTKLGLLHKAERRINAHLDQGTAVCRTMYLIVRDKLYLHATSTKTKKRYTTGLRRRGNSSVKVTILTAATAV